MVRPLVNLANVNFNMYFSDYTCQLVNKKDRFGYKVLRAGYFQSVRTIEKITIEDILKPPNRLLLKERPRVILPPPPQHTPLNKHILTLLDNIIYYYQKYICRNKTSKYCRLPDEILSLKSNQHMITHYQKLTRLFSYIFDILPKEDKHNKTHILPVLTKPHQDRGWVRKLSQSIIGIGRDRISQFIQSKSLITFNPLYSSNVIRFKKDIAL